MNDYKIGTLVDSKYFLQAVLEDRELCTTYRVWHTEWEVSLLARISKDVEKNVYHTLRKEAKEWIELGVHPNIVSACFYREIEGRLFLFLEALPATSLERIKNRIGYNLPEVLGIALETAHAMAYLHEEGIVHGNLRPESVLIDKYGRVKIADIRWDHWEGLETLTKRLRTTLYPHGFNMLEVKQEAVIRFSYRPPEYFLNKNYTLTPAADFYSFGMLLYDLLHNRLPFLLEEEVENLYLAYKKKHQENVPIKIEKGGNVPGELIELMESCLEKDPTKRPTQFHSLISTLANIYEFITGKPYLFERWPDNTLLAMSLNNRALGHVDSGKWDEAEEMLEEVSHLDISSVVPRMNLNLLKLHRGHISPALFFKKIKNYRFLNDWKVNFFEGKAALEYGSLNQKVLDDILGCDIVDERLDLLKAEIGYRIGDYHRARDIYREEIKKSTRQDTWYRLGAACLSLKLSKDAQQIWEKGLQQEIPLWDLMVGYSMLLAMHGQWADARCYLDQALRDLPSYIRHKPPFYTWSQIRQFRASETHGIIHASFSRDNRYLFAQTQDGKTHIWEWPSGKKKEDMKPDMALFQKTTRILQPILNAGVNDVAVSADGLVGVTVQGDCLVRVWDMKKSACIHELKGHTAFVAAVAITPDGKHVLSGGMDKTLRIWDVQSGNCLSSLEGHTDCVICIFVTEDGKLAISASWDRTIRIWNLEKNECVAILEGHEEDITALAVSNDGEIAASADTSCNTKIWNVRNKKLLAVLHSHEAKVTGVAISSDKKFVVCCSMDGTLSVYEDIAQRPCPCWVQSGYMLETLPQMKPISERQREKQMEKELHENLQSRQVLSAFQNYKELIQNDKKYFSMSMEIPSKLASLAETNGYEPSSLKEHTLMSVFIHDSQVIGFVLQHYDSLFSISQDGTFKRWHLSENRSDLFWQKNIGIQCLAISPDQKCFCFGGKEGIYVWRRENDRWSSLEGNASPVTCLKISEDGKKAVSGSKDGRLQYWDISREQLVSDWSAHQGMVTDLAITSDGMLALTSSVDGSIRCWDLGKRECIMQSQQKSRPLLSLSIAHKNHTTLMSGGLDGSIRQWSMGTGLCHNLIKAHPYPITSLFLHKDGTTVLSGDQQGVMKLWNLEMRKCLGSIEAHEEAITQVMLSPDGQWAFSSSKDHSVKVWKLDWEWKEGTQS